MSYQPPYTLTDRIVSLVAEISTLLGRLTRQANQERSLRLRRINRIRTVTGSLAIEGNTLRVDQITAILDGKHVVAPAREVQEARNALAAYEHMNEWDALREDHLLTAHKLLMMGLIDSAGRYRPGGVGVMAGQAVLHMAPPAGRVPLLMRDLFEWLAHTEAHPLLTSSVFHYEFEFIHPFADGNGRVGRLWQTVLLTRWEPLFAEIPVESMIFERQAAYYRALQTATDQTDCAPFIEFILEAIRDVVWSNLNDQVGDQVSDQVQELLSVMSNEFTSAAELMVRLGLSHRPTFRKNYLQPALGLGLIEMRHPDSPRSPRQKYRKK